MKKTLGRMAQANRWHPWVVTQDAVWIDLSGRVITVESIDGRYALNILKFVWRNHFKDLPKHSPLGAALRKIVARDLHLYADEIKLLIEKQSIRYEDFDISYADYADEDFWDNIG